MVIVGDADVPELITIAKHLGSNISGARMTIIENSAHLPSLEHPAEFNRILLDFLQTSSE